MSRLPQGFEMLEPFVADWVCDTTDDRIRCRNAASFEAVKAFHAEVTPHAARALDYLNDFDCDQLPPPEATLMKLIMMLAHTAMAVEVQRERHVPGVIYPHEIRVIQGLAPFG